MIGIETIKYSLRNLNQRRARSFLTIFSIFVGITTIFIFISFGYGLYNYVNTIVSSSSIDKVLIQARGIGITDDTFKLTKDDVEAVKRAAGVYEASGVYAKVVEVNHNNKKTYPFLAGYDPKTPLIMSIYEIKIYKGRELRPGDKKSAVLGYNYQVKDRIYSTPLEINDKIEVNGVDLKVIGFFNEVGNPSDDSQIYVTNDYVEELYAGKNVSYSMIVARADIDKLSLVIDNIEKSLRKERGLEKGKEDFFVQSFEEMLKSYSSVLNIVIGFIILIALISVLVSAINTANTMITSVLERYKEIGVLKAIGARNKEIFGIFLFESALLGFIAGVIGVLLGFLLSYLGGQILAGLGWSFLKPYYSFWLFAGCILFAVVTGAISGIIPAIKASKTNTVDALRYE